MPCLPGGSGDKAAPAHPADTLAAATSSTPGPGLSKVLWALLAPLPSPGSERGAGGGGEQPLPPLLFTRVEVPRAPGGARPQPAIRAGARGPGALLTHPVCRPLVLPSLPALGHAKQHSKPCNHHPGWAPPAGAGRHTHPRLPDQLPELAQIPSAPTPNAPPPSHRVTQVLAGTLVDPRPEEDSRAQRGRALALGSTGERAHPGQGQGTGQAPARTGSCGSAAWGSEGPERCPVPAHSLQPLPNTSGHWQGFLGQPSMAPGAEPLCRPKASACCVGTSQGGSYSLRHQERSGQQATTAFARIFQEALEHWLRIFGSASRPVGIA